MTIAGLSSAQTAYEATLVQQAATLAGSIQVQGTQAPVQAPAGASLVQKEAIGLEASVAGTLAASIAGQSTPPPAALEAPGTNPFQAAYSSTVLGQSQTLFGTLGIGTNTNTLV